ncbi:hypothetical protein JCM9492_05370 [Aquifex pyrophilus]
MNKLFEWFNERTEREKIILVVFPFLLIGVFYYLMLNPLLSEINRVEKELKDLKDVSYLLIRKKALEKEIEKLKGEREIRFLTVKEIYSKAREKGVHILEWELASFTKNILPKKNGLMFSDSSKLKGSIKTSLDIYKLKVIASEENLKSFLNGLTKDSLTFVIGLYTGCISRRELMRRENPPLVCEVGDYKRFLCDKESKDIPFYIVTLGTIRMEEGK